MQLIEPEYMKKFPCLADACPDTCCSGWDFIFDEASKRVATGVLNDVIGEAVMMNQPPSDKGKRLKIYYATQVGVRPPTFAIFVNEKELFHFSYQRYIENKLRENFGYEGTPLKIYVREKNRK